MLRFLAVALALAAPAATSPPTIRSSDQPPHVASSLTCDRGVWTSEPTRFAYAWLRDGRTIRSARDADYEATAGDAGHELACRVTATGDGGSASATSAPVRIGSPPVCDREAASCRAPNPPPPTGPAVKAFEHALARGASAARLKAHRLGARFRAPTAGTLSVRWSDAKGPIATARRGFAAKQTATVTLHLTKHGRAVLRTNIRGFLTHTEFKLPNGSTLAGSARDGEVTLRG